MLDAQRTNDAAQNAAYAVPLEREQTVSRKRQRQHAILTSAERNTHAVYQHSLHLFLTALLTNKKKQTADVVSKLAGRDLNNTTGSAETFMTLIAREGQDESENWHGAGYGQITARVIPAQIRRLSGFTGAQGEL